MEGPTIFELRLIFAPLFSQGLSKQSTLLNFQQTGQILAAARINSLRQEEIRSDSLNILKPLFHMQRRPFYVESYSASESEMGMAFRLVEYANPLNQIYLHESVRFGQFR